jgi:hypothetical protein
VTAVLELSPVVRVNGRELPDAVALVSVTIQLGLRVPGRVTLRVSDPAYVTASSGLFQLGGAVEVATRNNDSLIKATVTGLSLQHSAHDHPDLVVVCDDAAHKLARGSIMKSYLETTWSGIVEQMAGRHGLTSSVDSTDEVHPYVLQADTDMDFLNDIADRTGFDWWVEGSTLYFKKPVGGSPVLRMAVGEGLLEFSVNATALVPSAAKVTGWDRKQQQPIVSGQPTMDATVLPDAQFAQPS